MPRQWKTAYQDQATRVVDLSKHEARDLIVNDGRLFIISSRHQRPIWGH